MIHRREHLVPIADIGDECGCLPADLADLVGNADDLGLVQVDQRDIVPVAGESKRDPATDALACAGDQCDTHTAPSFGSTSTFIFVPACNASNPSSMTDSSAILSTHPVVSYVPLLIRSMTAS